MVKLDALKNSLRIDDDETEDDKLLETYIETAEAFVKGAVSGDDKVNGFYEKEDISKLFETAVLALASGYYTGRSTLSLVTLTPVDLATNSIIGQLRGRYVIMQEGE